MGAGTILVGVMGAGTYIVAVCAVGGLIACGAFVWAMRAGEFGDVESAKYLVFDDEDDVPRPDIARRDPPAA